MKLLSAVAFISLLLLSIVCGILLVATASANFIPEEPPPGFLIDRDGVVEGVNIHRGGNVYTLTGDIQNTIVILRDDIVLDGAGYTLQGNGDSTGIFQQDRVNVTIKNLNIKNFKVGIKFTSGDNRPAVPVSNTVIGNTITNNIYGISLATSTGCVISGNRIANNTNGVSFWSSNNILRSNTFENNKYSITDYTFSANDIDTSNTVNGKPVYYWVNQHDKIVPSDAGLLVLKDCSGITVQNLNLANNGHGVLLYRTTGSTVSGNVVTNNLAGITLEWSSGNVISGNYVANNQGTGVGVGSESKNNIISKNEIIGNAEDGVNSGSSSNIVSENHVAQNGGNGIFFRDINDSKVIGNNITLNKGCGIGFGYGPNGLISRNYIFRNGLGIWISSAAANTITLNTVKENDGWGIRLEGSPKDNVIHHNNFIDNSVEEDLQASILGVWTYPGLGKPPNQAEPPKFVPGAANAWDDGNEGNYWSDYITRYPISSEVDSSGVGDTPYFINDNNRDRYPLVKPVEVLEFPADPSLTNSAPKNSALPYEQQDSTRTTSLSEYAFVAIASAGLTATSYLLLKRRKSQRL